MSAAISVKDFIGAKAGEEKTILDIKRIYETDPRPLVCGYSGGKDSSVIVDLVLKALMKSDINSKPTYILFSDTKLEMKPFIEGVDTSFERLESFAKEHDLNLVIKRVEPKKTDTFSCLYFGAGYVLASSQYRWCTDRWKIKPQERAIKGLIKSHGGFISVTGQRRSESSDRAKRMEEYTIEGSLLKRHEYSLCNLYTPIEFYTADDVWDYLYTRQQPWIDSAFLGRVYSEAAGDTKNECRTLLEGVSGEAAGCSQSARSGCDICPLFRKDKTLINLSQHHTYLKEVEKFRNWLIDLSNESGWSERDVYMHGKNIQNIYDKGNHRDGMNIPGGMTLEFRKRTLRKYLELDEKLFPATGERRVTDFELSYIQERWIEEGEHELGVYKLTDRVFDISDHHKEILEAVLIYKQRFYKESKYVEGEVHHWFPPHWSVVDAPSLTADARYYAQLSIQLKKLGRDPIFYAKLFTHSLEEKVLKEMKYGMNISDETFYDVLRADALVLIKTLPVSTKQYYSSAIEEEYIRWEWKNDQVGVLNILERYQKGELKKPKPTLFGYEGEFGLQFEQIDELYEKQDITLCETISLQDQMTFFDRW